MAQVIPGSVASLGAIVQEIDPRSVVVFAGGGSYELSGAAGAIRAATDGVAAELIRDIPENPDLVTVNTAIARYRSVEPGLVIAVGGGSVLDLAKVVNAIAPLTRDARPFVTGEMRIESGSVPLVAIPTTSGSGSEATRYAVVTVDGTKQPMGSEFLLPTHVILDPQLTNTVPPEVAASTGLDALAHAMEAVWSVRSDEASSQVAARGLALAVSNIEAAVNSPDDRSRSAMMEAAHLGGIAIDTAPTSAPHALSFRITTDHGVPHGHAVALTLGAVLEYNEGVTEEGVNDSRGVEHVRSAIADICEILGVPDAKAGRLMLHHLIEAIGLEPTLTGVGAGSVEARDALAAAVSPLRLANNPRSFQNNTLREMISTIP